MKSKTKKILISSAVGIGVLVVILLVMFWSGVFTTSNTQNGLNAQNIPDYIDYPQSEFAIGGTLSGQSYTPLSLDVASCSFGQDSVGYGFGHTVFVVDGKDGSDCVFRYGSEIENPMWDGALTAKCEVPSSLNVTLSVGNMGIDESPIEQYCAKI